MTLVCSANAALAKQSACSFFSFGTCTNVAKNSSLILLLTILKYAFIQIRGDQAKSCWTRRPLHLVGLQRFSSGYHCGVAARAAVPLDLLVRFRTVDEAMGAVAFFV